MNQAEFINRVNSKIKGLPFPFVVNDSCSVCGHPATGYILKSEDLSQRKPVCERCGLMISQEHYRFGRNIIIKSVDPETISKFNKGLKPK